MQKLIEAINAHQIPSEIAEEIDDRVQLVETFDGSPKEWRKKIRKTYRSTVALLEKELKIVRKHHYRDTWMPMGMAMFGVPIGTAFATAIGNFGLMSTFFPIGMIIGMMIGSQMDKKAQLEGRQLAI